MEINMRANLKMDKNMVMENYISLTMKNILDNLNMIKCMDREHSTIQTDLYMRDNFKIIKEMVRG